MAALALFSSPAQAKEAAQGRGADETQTQAAYSAVLSETSEEGYVYTVSDGGAVITDYTGTSTVLDIPSSIDGYSVWKIENSAFFGKNTLTKATIPSTVTTIGNCAFKGCTGLTEVVINAEELEDASSNSSSLGYPYDYNYSIFYQAGSVNGMRVVFGEGATRIPAYLFATGRDKSADAYCKVREIEIPASVEEVGTYAFGRCYDLASVTFVGTAPTFGENCFLNDTLTAKYDLGKNWSADMMKDYGGSVTWTGYGEVAPTATPTPTVTPTPTAAPIATPTPTPTVTPTPMPTATPVPTETPTPTMAPVPTATPTATPAPTPTPIPIYIIEEASRTDNGTDTSVEVRIFNHHGSEAVLIAAAYDDKGRMIGYDLQPINVSIGASGTLAMTVKQAAGAKEIRLFVANRSTYRPMGKAWILE